MAKPVWQLQRELDAAKAREAYYSNPNRPVKATRDAQPRDAYAYRALFLRIGTAVPLILVQPTRAAVARFTEGNLGLTKTPDDLSSAIAPPRHFKPSKIRAMVGDNTPTVKKAFGGTGRRYVKYSGNTAGEAQAHYEAPISAGNATPTLAEVKNKAEAIKTSLGATLGQYGRLTLSLEHFNQQLV